MRGAVPIYQIPEVVDAPHVLNTAQGPNRLLFASAGIAIGLLLGLLVAAFVQHTRIAVVFACLGAGGCLIGAAISFAMPQRYVSQATVRIVYFDRLAGTAEGRDWMVKNMNEVLSRESLSEMIQRPELNLCPTERAKLPLKRSWTASALATLPSMFGMTVTAPLPQRWTSRSPIGTRKRRRARLTR